MLSPTPVRRCATRPLLLAGLLAAGVLLLLPAASAREADADPLGQLDRVVDDVLIDAGPTADPPPDATATGADPGAEAPGATDGAPTDAATAADPGATDPGAPADQAPADRADAPADQAPTGGDGVPAEPSLAAALLAPPPVDRPGKRQQPAPQRDAPDPDTTGPGAGPADRFEAGPGPAEADPATPEVSSAGDGAAPLALDLSVAGDGEAALAPAEPSDPAGSAPAHPAALPYAVTGEARLRAAEAELVRAARAHLDQAGAEWTTDAGAWRRAMSSGAAAGIGFVDAVQQVASATVGSDPASAFLDAHEAYAAMTAPVEGTPLLRVAAELRDRLERTRAALDEAGPVDRPLLRREYEAALADAAAYWARPRLERAYTERQAWREVGRQVTDEWQQAVDRLREQARQHDTPPVAVRVAGARAVALRAARAVTDRAVADTELAATALRGTDVAAAQVTPVLIVPRDLAGDEVAEERAALADALREAQAFYLRETGGTFQLRDFEVIRSDHDREHFGTSFVGGDRYSDGTVLDRERMWTAVVEEVERLRPAVEAAVPRNEAAHVFMVFLKGAGCQAGTFGAAGSPDRPGDEGVALVGDCLIDAIQGRLEGDGHTWGASRDEQVGALIHELGHAFGLAHPEDYLDTHARTVMSYWRRYPRIGLTVWEADRLRIPHGHPGNATLEDVAVDPNALPRVAFNVRAPLGTQVLISGAPPIPGTGWPQRAWLGETVTLDVRPDEGHGVTADDLGQLVWWREDANGRLTELQAAAAGPVRVPAASGTRVLLAPAATVPVSVEYDGVDPAHLADVAARVNEAGATLRVLEYGDWSRRLAVGHTVRLGVDQWGRYALPDGYEARWLAVDADGNETPIGSGPMVNWRVGQDQRLVLRISAAR